MKVDALLVPTSLPLSGSELYGGLFWPVYLVWLVSEMLVLSRRRAARAAAATRDGGSVRLLQAMIVLGLVSSFTSAINAPATAFAHHRRTLFFLGVAMMIAGLVLRWYAVHVLGRFFTFDVAIHARHTLVQAGPYRWVRHPAYAGSLLTFAGIGLALGSWLGLFLLMAFVAAGYAVRIRVEERALASALGAPYRAYMDRTRRLIPFLL